MDNSIKKILEDLYRVDSSLKKHEKDLVKLIKEMLMSKPDTKFDKNFAFELKEKLLHQPAQKLSLKNNILDIKNFNPMKKLLYALSGAVIALVLIIPISFLVISYPSRPQQKIGKTSVKTSKISSSPIIKPIAKQAFGTLSASGQPNGAKTLSSTEASPAAAAHAPVAATGRGGAGVAHDMAKVAAPAIIGPMPPMFQYNYKYEGDELKLEQGEMEVLKRVKNTNLGAELAQSLNLNLGFLDFSKIENPAVQNISFLEDRDFGYSIYFDLQEGAINIGQNWNRWHDPYAECQGDPDCYNQKRLKEADVPEDNELIAMANDFLARYGISTENYAEPEVENNWRTYYAEAAEADKFIPDEISILYPLLLNGKKVYDVGGSKVGLRLNVNIRFKKVSGLWDFTMQNYESSMYEMETDGAKLIGLAEKGGYGGGYYPLMKNPEDVDSNTKVAEIKIGTPESAYVKIYKYQEGKSEELFVPALIFPVTPPEGVNFYNKNIIIPLSREILAEREKEQTLTPVMPMRAK